VRILYVISRADALGGAAVHVRDLSMEARDRGHDARVAIGGEGQVTDALTKAGIAFESLHHLRRELHPLHDALAVRELRGVIKKLKPDLISAHASKAGFVGRMAARSVGVPVIYTPHCWSFVDGFPRAKLYLLAEKIASRWGDRVVAVSEEERQIAISQGVCRAEKITRIYNGMPDVAAHLRASPEECPPRMVMIARFEEQKDHSTVVRALAQLEDLPWSLDLVGDGPTMAGVRRQVAEAGLTSRVHFLGYRTDIPQILAQAQIYLLISNWEGFPRSIIEAMRAGLPVVTSDVGGSREAVQQDVTGFTVPKGDAEGLASKLRILLADPETRARMGSAGRASYEANFTFERMADKTFALYEEVAGSAKRPDPSPIAAG
jgi:glycosyltransferase involved in cell wall biosynthesis